MKKKSKGLNTMTSTIILSICLGLSMMVNGFFFWYNRQLLSRISFISNNIDDLMKMITNYRDHLVSVYNMEMFYGDETLQFLLSHTRDLKEMLEEYEDVLYITEPIEEIEVVDDQQEEETNGPPQVEEENVFYAGARRRDS
jgi:hypothetical protein